MTPRFGTSGLRGLVVELTDDLVADHLRGFLAACDPGTGLFVGRDLRPSSPALAATVMAAAAGEGVAVTDCGAVPTPALALAAMQAGAAAVMVTGSHIPADRNGLKFYRPDGEIGKADEAAILGALGRPPAGLSGLRTTRDDVARGFADRYLRAYGGTALADLRIGVYQHSTVIRDLLVEILAALGADVVPLGRSETFVPVDTEAVDGDARRRLADWAAAERCDAVVSADGDADRPLVADAQGGVLPGDLLGPVTAHALGAEVVVTPVSSNTMVSLSGRFDDVRTTRIGSPHVIAGMEAAMAAGARVAGYEANGGFLLGFEAQGPAGRLDPLMTRDCVLPIVAPLAEARAAGVTLAQVLADWPARRTASGRLENTPSASGAAFVAMLSEDTGGRAALLDGLGEVAATDTTDGLRMTLSDRRILHFRPSGNAPELRCYAEADDAASAEALRDAGLARAAAWIAQVDTNR